VTGQVTGTQLISNIATGTSPLVITSTTVVPNLNASALGGSARETTLSTTSDTKIPTSKAIATYTVGLGYKSVVAGAAIGLMPALSNTSTEFLNGNGA